ncbi:unnamed protein product, partial [marine sediment metagenome]
ETQEERFVRIPEEGGRDLISADPLAPGMVYAACVGEDGTISLYRLEVGTSSGPGRLRPAGGLMREMKESIQRAFAYLQGHKVEWGLAKALDTIDFHVEAVDLLGSAKGCEAGIAFIVALASAVKKTPVLHGLIILGDLSIMGTIKTVFSLAELLQLAMDNGAKRALIPLENKRNFLEVSGDTLARVDPIFYPDPRTAVAKALGIH